ncbi:MAG: hypothetical protein OEY09_04865 [Gammaproteobacteria bacterium]|nr:hypothetical protein [Gammaproteobacteria bacterium]
MIDDKSKPELGDETIDTSRRSALSRLGLVATAAYAAPVLMTLSKSAHASGGSGGGGRSGGGSGGGNSGGSDGASAGSEGASTGSEGASVIIPEEENNT